MSPRKRRGPRRGRQQRGRSRGRSGTILERTSFFFFFFFFFFFLDELLGLRVGDFPVVVAAVGDDVPGERQRGAIGANGVQV